jgi:hypothetical protein
MLNRIWYWLFHKHTFEDVNNYTLSSSHNNAVMFIQKCTECGEYKENLFVI